MNITPQVLRIRDYGIVIAYKRSRIWSDIITRDASHVYAKHVRNAVVDASDRAFSYAPGVAVAAHHFLNPALGIAEVMPSAKLILENIMHAYAINTSTSRIVGRFADTAGAQAVAGENPAVKVVESVDDVVGSFTSQQMADIMTAATGQQTKRYKHKQTGAALVWEHLESIPQCIDTTKSQKPKASVKQRLRAIFATGDARLHEDAVLKMLGCTASALATAISDLKNPKYAGGDVLTLVRDKQTRLVTREHRTH